MKPKPGDILLVVPLKRPLRLPKFTLTALFGLATTLSYNAAHVAIYTGKVVEQTFSNGLHAVGFEQFIEDLSQTYAQFWIYTIRPTHFKRENKKKLLEILKNYETTSMPYHLSHALKIRFFPKAVRLLVEPLEMLRGICSTFAAFVLKKSGIDIGKKSSLTFHPGTFLKNKKFKTIKKTMYSEGKAVKMKK
ncbi:MAG: hypothetical protein Q7K43_00750 [Candidatus Woesearchaeota archaeon]|nr:hypothetical protein [Candidatus Woesearchaeota archaeon]